MNERTMFDNALDRVQQLTRDVAKLQRKLGRKAYWANHYHARADKAEQAEIALSGKVTELEDELAKLRGEHGLSTEKQRCYESATAAVQAAHASLTDLGIADDGSPLADRMDKLSAETLALIAQAADRGEELAVVREQRDRLVTDNTALANARDEYRKEKHRLEEELKNVQQTLRELTSFRTNAGVDHDRLEEQLSSEREERERFEQQVASALTEAGAPAAIGGFIDRVRHLGRQLDVDAPTATYERELREKVQAERNALEDELRQVRHTLSLREARIVNLDKQVGEHRDYAVEVCQHSQAIHDMACQAVNLPLDWHLSGPAREEEAA